MHLLRRSFTKCSLVVVLLVIVQIVHVQPSHYQKPRHLGGFTIKDDAEDLLALPSDTNSAPVVVAPIDRNGPITTYAQQHTDNKAEESFGGGVISVVPPSSHNGNQLAGGNINYQGQHSGGSGNGNYEGAGNSNYQRSQGGGGNVNYQGSQGGGNVNYQRSQGGGGNVNYQNPQGYQNQQQYQQQYQPPQRPTVLHPRPQGQGQNSQQISASASVQYPQAQLLQQQSQQQFSTIYQQPQQLQNLPNIHQPIMAQFSNPQVVAYSPGVGVGYHTALLDNNVPLFASGSETAVHHDQKVLGALGSEAELYKAAIKNPLHLIDSVLKFFKQFAVPKEHYLNTISFAGIYLFMSILFYGSEDLLQLTCDSKSKSSEKEWHYHVGRRFVPGMQVDGKLQKKFLKLFEGMHLDDDGGDGSSSEEMSAELAGVNEVCPRGHFFYSLSPMHLEARMQIQRLFVAQKSPLDVYLLAKDLLYKHKIHPKIWYLGLVAAALERDDMTGFKIVHPIDAIPDWFIPAEYIKDEMESRSRSLLNRAKRDAENDNSTLTISSTSSTTTTTTTTTARPKITKITKRPYSRRPYVRRTTTLRPLPESLESGSVEFVLDGAPKRQTQNDLIYDEDAINNSIRNYNYGNGHKQKNKKKNKNKKTVVKDPETIEAISAAAADSASQENDIGPLEPIAAFLVPEVNNDLPQSDKGNDDDDDDDDEGNRVNRPFGDGKHKHKPLAHGGHKKNKHKGYGNNGGNDGGIDGGEGGDGGNGGGDSSEEDHECIVVGGKHGEDNGIENKLWYFREDLMLNQNHWYWHLTHPVNATKHPDRRAELFFFTHRNFLARYNAERISNGLHRTVEMKFGPGGIMAEPYHSHLADVASGKYWTPRHASRHLKDILHEHNPDISKNIMLYDVATIYSRLLTAVNKGKLITKSGKYLPISHSKGLEPLANTVEATDLSVNPMWYDSAGLHNMGHLVIGLVEDPAWKYKKTPGVMSEVATSMRDPIFYNYHTFLDNIFEKYKQTLPPYKVVGGEFPLLWKGIEILDVEVMSKGNGPLNQLRTFWTKKKFELAPSVDKSTDQGGDAHICAVHLAHEPFTFKITIERKSCAKSKSGKGTIRIFMAPRFDEKGRRLHLKEQRRLMFKLDSFQAKLRVGRNIITRRSHDSSLTKPWTKSLRDYEHADPTGAADFCGCGFPQHLYIPKGNSKGMPFDLFVMVTNYDEDHVPNHPKDLEIPETCNSPYIFCGLPKRRYPDARPMGYPWDRPPYKTPIPCLPGHSFASTICKSFNIVFFKPIDSLEQFVARAPNMKSIVFDIKHIDKLIGHHQQERRSYWETTSMEQA